MRSKRLADGAGESTTLLLADTRASQALEPVRLPPKLRERVERAQRRAAAKDGVSIFSADAKDGSAAARRASTAAAVAAMSESTGVGAGDGKTHLPEVVLSHKMRDFEARANAGGTAALLLADPPERSLQRLSLEDRERVMLVMQSKIQQLAGDVEANFVRLTRALDAHGIFAAAANAQRAQTLCLVELQRRCKLDRLRDEALREVLELPPELEPRSLRTRQLSQLLQSDSVAVAAGAKAPDVPVGFNASKRRRKPSRTSRLPKLQSSTRGSGQKHPQSSASPLKSPLTSTEAATGSNRMLKRRSGLPPELSTPATREEATAPAGSASARESDLFARHPHVAQVLQQLATGDSTAASSNNSNAGGGSAEADMEHARVLAPASEWAQRSASYQAVGARATETLRRRAERQRWDALGHFGHDAKDRVAWVVSAALRQRLEAQQDVWTRHGMAPAISEDSDDAGGGTGDAQTAADRAARQQRDHDAYVELQTRIRERLRASERRTRTAAAAVRAAGARTRIRQAQTAPAKTSQGFTGVLESEDTSTTATATATATTTALGVSISEPVLPSMAAPEAVATPQGRVRPGSRARSSILEQKLLLLATADPSTRAGRGGARGRRQDALIGAPRAQLESVVLGRHSDARMAQRRYSAQTWAWRPPVGAPGGPEVVEPVIEEVEEEIADHFHEDEDEDGDALEEDEDEDYEEDEDDEDWESMDSSHAPASARSTLSVASVKRRVGSASSRRSNSKRATPGGLQRKLSRGSSSRGGLMGVAAALSGNALTLHARLESVWRGLQFPFSHKLAMLERVAQTQDAEAFSTALDHWERALEFVAIRERMKLALGQFAEREELRPSERLTSSECAMVAALPPPPAPPKYDSDLDEEKGETEERDMEEKTVSPPSSDRKTDPAVLAAPHYIVWIQDHIDAVTLQTQKLAQELKACTGEELEFQGRPYPPRV